jgi:starvation-inducible outer membrane lipoprotein
MGAWLAADGAPSIICNLDASYSGNQVRLQGRIISSSKVAGRYSLEICRLTGQVTHRSINLDHFR